MPINLLTNFLFSVRATGSVAPSSQHLAAAMAKAAHGTKAVVELGAGTGPITRALLKDRHLKDLVAVELCPHLASQLKRSHPGLDVRQEAAHEVLESMGLGEPVAIVSSLPFRSLPPSVCAQTIQAITAFLSEHPGSYLIQFTYQPRAPFLAPKGFEWERLDFIWRNTPPAGVWKLSETSALSGSCAKPVQARSRLPIPVHH